MLYSFSIGGANASGERALEGVQFSPSQRVTRKSTAHPWHDILHLQSVKAGATWWPFTIGHFTPRAEQQGFESSTSQLSLVMTIINQVPGFATQSRVLTGPCIFKFVLLLVASFISEEFRGEHAYKHPYKVICKKASYYKIYLLQKLKCRPQTASLCSPVSLQTAREEIVSCEGVAKPNKIQMLSKQSAVVSELSREINTSIHPHKEYTPCWDA